MYERKQDSQVFYVLPVESILGKLPVVPIGDTGTIPYSMRQHAADFVDAAFDTREGAGDGSRWWYNGTSTLGPWAGPANAARNEETQPDFLPALKWQYEEDKQQQN